jgi:hypothetical protein
MYFARIDAAGNKLGSEIPVATTPGQSFLSSIVTDNGGYTIVWNDDSLDANFDIFTARRTADGSRITDEVRVAVTAPVSQFPLIARAGNLYGVAWEEMNGTAGELSMRLLDAAGSPSGVVTPVASMVPGVSGPSMVWSESAGAFALAWPQRAEGTNTEIFLAELDADLVRVRGNLRVSNGPGDSLWPRLVTLDGGAYGLAFHDSRDGGTGNEEIYFARVCPR